MTKEEFRKIKEQRRLSTKEMAALLGVSIRTVNHYLSGEITVTKPVIKILELTK